MKQFRSSLILGLGFFALVAQTLLFRDFLAAFEGSELGVGSFFGSWLLWVGLGAVLAGVFGLPVSLCAALGYAAVFGSASNTLLAPALIGAEVFGWAGAPAFLIACAAAYVVNGNRSIYSENPS